MIAPQVRNPLPLGAKECAVLDTRRYLQLHRPLERWNLHGISQSGLGEAYGQLIQQIISIALKELVGLHIQSDVQIAGSAAACSSLSFASKPDLGVVLNPWWYGNLQLSRPALLATAPAHQTWLRDDLALTATRGDTPWTPRTRSTVPMVTSGDSGTSSSRTTAASTFATCRRQESTSGNPASAPS